MIFTLKEILGTQSLQEGAAANRRGTLARARPLEHALAKILAVATCRQKFKAIAKTRRLQQSAGGAV